MLKSGNFAKFLVTFSCAVLFMLDAVAAYSQEKDKGVLEEVIVTAQRRTENLQDIPLAVTSFSARNLSDKGVYDLFWTDVPGAEPGHRTE